MSSSTSESEVFLSSTDSDTLRKVDRHMCFHIDHIVQLILVTTKGRESWFSAVYTSIN